MSEINAYQEGERIAELAVEDRISRKGLDNLATYAYSHPKEATRFFLRKQASRGYLSVSFMKELEALLDKTTSLTFSKTMRIAYDYYLWKENEEAAETLYHHKTKIEKVVQNYSTKLRLGNVSTSITIERGRLQLQVSFDKRVFDKRRASMDLTKEIRNKVPELKPLNFQIWIKT